MNNDEEIVDVIVAWMTLIWILLGACVLGLILTLVKVALNYFGIPNPL